MVNLTLILSDTAICAVPANGGACNLRDVLIVEISVINYKIIYVGKECYDFVPTSGLSSFFVVENSLK